ncbi:hypothetical protein AGOR_G00073480 [Albula goreensis]|uniref:Fibronectin type-III domain-containing protein n=1 Tax=Albula goreensis TaxID=1534307 RepID=A0A8T3DT24_9TELE|nr:hypothetical protein AGOR_G00073480 [Albula goreensis]
MDLRFTVFFLIVYCWMAFALVPHETGALPPPSQLSLSYINNFCVNLSWSPPENLSSSICEVEYLMVVTVDQENETHRIRKDTHFESCLDIDRGVNYILRAQPQNCTHRTLSQDVVWSIPPSEEKLVKDFECIYYSSGSMNCTWSPADQTTDLQLYYWYKNMAQPLKPCGLYLYTGGLKTGCHLHGDFLNVTNLTTEVFFLINRTHGPSTLQNKFKRTTRDNMKPWPPKLTIKRADDMLELHCDPPSGFDPRLNYWDYTYRYRTSKDSNWKEIPNKSRALSISYNHHFQYRVQVKAICKSICGTGASDWSLEESYGQDKTSERSFPLALITVPVVVTICAILLLFFLKRLQVLILPQIPDPLKSLKDLTYSKNDPTLPGSSTTKSLVNQRVYVPENPELCLDVKLVETEPILEPRPFSTSAVGTHRPL